MTDILESKDRAKTDEEQSHSLVLLTLIERNALMTAEELAEDTGLSVESVTKMLTTLTGMEMVRTYARDGTSETFYRECCSPLYRAGHQYTPHDFSLDM